MSLPNLVDYRGTPLEKGQTALVDVKALLNGSTIVEGIITKANLIPRPVPGPPGAAVRDVEIQVTVRIPVPAPHNLVPIYIVGAAPEEKKAEPGTEASVEEAPKSGLIEVVS